MKQDWIVTIHLTENEGGPDTTLPWYHPQEVEALIHGVFNRSMPMRDLTITRVHASENGSHYMEAK